MHAKADINPAHMPAEEEINMGSIHAADIYTVSAWNIIKFLNEHPEHNDKRQAIEERISAFFSGAMTNGYRPLPQGNIIPGRKYITSILKELADAFFEEMATNPTQIRLALEKIHELECSL